MVSKRRRFTGPAMYASCVIPFITLDGLVLLCHVISLFPKAGFVSFSPLVCIPPFLQGAQKGISGVSHFILSAARQFSLGSKSWFTRVVQKKGGYRKQTHLFLYRKQPFILCADPLVPSYFCSLLHFWPLLVTRARLCGRRNNKWYSVVTFIQIWLPKITTGLQLPPAHTTLIQTRHNKTGHLACCYHAFIMANVVGLDEKFSDRWDIFFPWL